MFPKASKYINPGPGRDNERVGNTIHDSKVSKDYKLLIISF